MQKIVTKQALTQNGWKKNVEIAIEDVRIARIQPAPEGAIAAQVFGGNGQHCIKDVRCAGRHVVKDGRHIARDAVIRNFIATMADLEQDI